ncbi:hypothetical protein C2S52_008527 [Perilla frutescens var. hirtella]|nr:hypothetical protein C2S52_008527 [Perilla frutescens var. hirtella]
MENYKKTNEITTFGIQSHLSSAVADGTRLMELQDNQKKLNQMWQAESSKSEGRETSLNEQITAVTQMQEGISKKLDQLIMTAATLQLQLLNGRPKKGIGDEGSTLGEPEQNYVGEGSQSRTQFTSKKETLPELYGIQGVPCLLDKEKVTLAAKNFKGRAVTWLHNFNSKYDNVSWEQFVEIVAARFEDIRESKKVMELNKLKHTGNYMDYVNRFKELRECLLRCNMEAYSEVYFVACFLSGLSDELRAAVLIFNPTTLEQVPKLGKSQLITLEATTQKLKEADQACNQSWTNSYPKEVTSSPSFPSQIPVDEPVCLQSSNTIEDDPGLTGFKDGVQISTNTIQGETKSHNNSWVNVASKMSEEEKLTYVQPLITLENDPGSEVRLSLNTLKGEDTLTTHKFSVANGQKLISSSQDGNFSWKIQEDELHHLLRLLQHEGSDIILGRDWLRACTPMELDYEKMTIIIRNPHSKITLSWISYQEYNITKKNSKLSAMSLHFGYKKFWIASYHRDKHFENIMASKTYDPISYLDFTLPGGILRFKGRVVVGVAEELRSCWSHICMDCIEGLPKDKIFTNHFWRELVKLLGVTLNLSSSYYPQIHGPINRLSKCPENYPRGLMLQCLKFFTQQTQNHMKVNADKSTMEKKFEGGNWGYLKIQPYRQSSVLRHKNLKLSLPCYGVLEKVGQVAYRLDLTDRTKVYHVFHILLLKKKVGEEIIPLTELASVDEEGTFKPAPTFARDTRTIQRGRDQVTQLLVKWGEESEDLVPWEDVEFLQRKFPQLDPWGQGFNKGGSNVMNITVPALKMKEEEVMEGGDVAIRARRLLKIKSLGLMADLIGEEKRYSRGRELKKGGGNVVYLGSGKGADNYAIGNGGHFVKVDGVADRLAVE